MATANSASAIEASLEPDQRQAFKDLIDDYNAAAKLHARRWRGGISPRVAAELVRRGVPICVRSVGNLLDRYDELLALSCADVDRLKGSADLVVEFAGSLRV